MPRNRRNSSTSVVVTIEPGAIATCGDPGKCLIANDIKSQGFPAAKVTALDIRLSVPVDHPRVIAGDIAPGRYILPSPGMVGQYIAQYDSTGKFGEEREVENGAEFIFDLYHPDVVYTAPRPDRSEETRRAALQPQRAAQNRAKAQRDAIRNGNARLRRVGKPAMSQEEVERYLTSVGL
jgi:hypothetical protein